MEENGIYGFYQSAYRAMRKSHWCGYTVTSPNRLTLAHNTLLRTAATVVWIRIIWGRSRLADIQLFDPTYVVRVKSGVAEVDTMTTGVPQWTVHLPLLFNAYD